MHECDFLALWHFFLFRPRIFPIALGSVARRESTRTPHASLGPGRGPWHVLWGFKEASPLREGLRARIAIQVHANPRTGCGGKTKMSDGMRMFRILLAPGTRSLPKFRAHVRVLVLVLEYSRARARARVLVSARVLECSSLECSCSSTRCARLLVLDCSTARVLEWSSCSRALVNVLVWRSCRARTRMLVRVLSCSRARARARVLE